MLDHTESGDLQGGRRRSCRWPPTPRARARSSTTRAGPSATTRSFPPAGRSTAACAGSRTWPPRLALTPGWTTHAHDEASAQVGRQPFRADDAGAPRCRSAPEAANPGRVRRACSTRGSSTSSPPSSPASCRCSRRCSSVAPPATYRIAGMKIARQPHRYSGRTAMHADETVFEPKPLDDPQSPLAFSMEGYQGAPPSPIVPRFWAPGWNSPQAINKLQHGPDQPLPGGDVGVRLIEPAEDVAAPHFLELPRRFRALGRGRACGPGASHLRLRGDERARRRASPSARREPYLGLSPGGAAALGLGEGRPGGRWRPYAASPCRCRSR